PSRSSLLTTFHAVSLHDALPISLVGVAILIGYGIQQGLIFIEASTWGEWTDVYLLSYIPLFPLAMVGGMIVQKVFEKQGIENYIDRKSTRLNSSHVSISYAVFCF